MKIRNLCAILLTVFAVAAIALVLAGCNGSGNSVTPAAQTAAWKQVGATYVGRIRCRDCHATIDDEYSQQDMGDNEPTRMSGTNCQKCHVTGYGQPGGFNPDGSTPHLDGIGCENCHGPGSKHVNASTTPERKANITRTPPAKDACYGCHGGRHKFEDDTYGPGALLEPNPIITDATLHDVVPRSVPAPHYAAASFLFGRGVYGLDVPLPSPHSTMENTCLNCHKPGISATTGKVKHGEDALLPPNLDTSRQPCSSCHGGRENTLVQAGVKELLIKLGGADADNPEEPDRRATGGMLAAYVTANNIDIQTNAAPDDPHVIAYKAARYQIIYVLREGSFGVHNPGLAQRMLQDAYAKLSD